MSRHLQPGNTFTPYDYTSPMRRASRWPHDFRLHDIRKSDYLDHAIMNFKGKKFSNLQGSGEDNQSGTWIQKYRAILEAHGYQDYYGNQCSAVRSDGTRCGFIQSGSHRLHGGHVMFSGDRCCYIIPLCPTHNNPSRKETYICGSTFAVRLYESIY